MDILTWDKKKHKMVLCGYFDHITHTFCREVKKKHFMHLEKGYGIQESCIQDLIHLKCEGVIMKTPDGLFTSKFNQWLSQTTSDYGHGLQRFLPLYKMTLVKKEDSKWHELKEFIGGFFNL